MTDISRHPRCSALKLIIIVLWSQWASGFQNAYDLMERRQYRNDPRGGVFETSERYYNRDRYSTHNRSPTSVYSSVRPIDDDRRFNVDRRTSFPGNGYDNLGNGDHLIRLNSGLSDRRRFDSFRDSSRRFDNNPRDYDSFRESSRLDFRRPTTDTFRDTSRLYDRQGVDSFRDVSRLDTSLVDPIRDGLSSSRSADPFRDLNQFSDRSLLDPIRESGRFDSRARIDKFDEPLRIGDRFDDRTRIDNFDEPRRIKDRFDDSRVIDIAPPRRLDDIGSGSQLLPSLERRSSYPEFYRRDYFTRPVAKSGFEAQNSDNKYQSAGGGKENSGLSTVGSFVTSNEDKNQKKTDSGYHDNKEGTKLDVDNKEKIGETTRFDKNGGNKSTVKSNRVSKKGHTTKGFAKHHHKDETGNSTTFFDESLDEGGQEDFQDLEDEFGSRKTTEIINGKEDGRFFQEIGGKTGNFGSGVLKDNKKVEKDIVANNNRFSNEEKFGTGQDSADRGFKTASEYLGGGVWDDPHRI